MSTIERAHLVCATPRSGSTLLCELLKSTGVAGRPEEYFETLRATGYPRQPRQYFEGAPEVQAALPEVDPGTPECFFDWDAVLRAGTTPNGVFGAKVMWSHLDDLGPRLGGRRLDDLLPGLRYVRVSRRDRVAQAVSLWIAIQTQHWRDEGDIRQAHEPVYSFTAIRHLVQQLTADELAWDEWLVGRDVIDASYEELAAAPGATVSRILERLGLDGRAPDVPRMRRQSGERSREWIERYGQEAA
jgi:trehalose 2-sulfotransferase